MCNIFKKKQPIEDVQEKVIKNKQEMIDVVNTINKFLENGDIKAEIVIRKIHRVAKE